MHHLTIFQEAQIIVLHEQNISVSEIARRLYDIDLTSAGCHHCEGRPEDMVEFCPAWAEHRRVLVEAIGGSDLSRPALVETMIRSEREWEAVTWFQIIAHSSTQELGQAKMSKVITRSQAKLLLKLQEDKEKEKLEQDLYNLKVAKAVINLLEGTKDEEVEFFHHFKVLNNIDRDLHRMKMSDKDFAVEIKELTKERMELWHYLLDSQLNCFEKRKECQKLTKEKKDRRLLLEILMRKL